MDYTATVSINTQLDIDTAIDQLAEYSGSLAQTEAGYRAVFSYPAHDLAQATKTALTIANTIGTPISITVATTESVDRDTAHGDIPPVVSVAEAANILDISPQAIHKRIKTGSLPATRVGNTWILPLAGVLSAE
ncbi:helix-turn-helix domain-containing protein [Trueperella bernardiae]|uniref:helix-turn-helix domain-containing protein n=1 Tax=Trueperella bernardiae TaxID=59561 RepID=UPI000837D0BF|nr:helix-turn-helix domain-containing protein [Trueperella bernardiae]MCM3907615.1 helix-turn-helix domain-containing protein [Trueperella bernardiae]